MPDPDLAARLAATAQRSPGSVALRWQDREVTYAELDSQVDAAAGALQHLGVGPGDRVAVLLGNTPAFVEAHFGTLRAGAAVVPLNPGLQPPELEHILRDSGAHVVIAMEGLAETLLDLRQKVATLTHVVTVGTGPGDASWTALVEAGHPYEPVERRPQDLAALVYTSGTTGLPRGAMLSRVNLAAAQDQSLAGRLRIEPTDTVLLVLPLFHIYALNVGLGASVRVGATMVLVERFDPVGSLEEIERHGVGVILGAPPMYVAWLNTAEARQVDLSGVRVAVSGAAPLPAHVLRRAREELGLTVWEGYGLTEAAPSVTSNAMGDEVRPGSVGLPLPGVEIRLVDDEGRDVETGDPGEVWVRGANVFDGYWNDPTATKEVLTEDGWLRTGDIGTRDRDGFLYLVDRKRDLILVSGFNVYPREVERVLERHPAVSQCAVVGVPHPYTGETVKAYVVVRPGAEVTEDDLALFTRTELARYKCPETVEFVSELPHTATGKVRRGALRDRG